MSLFWEGLHSVVWRGEESIDVRFLISKMHIKRLCHCIKYRKTKRPM